MRDAGPDCFYHARAQHFLDNGQLVLFGQFECAFTRNTDSDFGHIVRMKTARPVEEHDLKLPLQGEPQVTVLHVAKHFDVERQFVSPDRAKSRDLCLRDDAAPAVAVATLIGGESVLAWR